MRNPAVSPVTAEELARRLQSESPSNEKPDGGYALFDVRPPDAFARQHVPGAENAPVEDVAELRRRFAREKVVVLYGDVDEDADAHEAAASLSASGFVRIQCLEGGFAAWLEAQQRLEHARRERAGRRQLRSWAGPSRPDDGD